MHSTDRQLRSLLCEHESTKELQPIAQHVEHCQHCQQRLDRMTGAGEWTTELVRTLREDETHPDESIDDQAWSRPITLILDQASDGEEPLVELDSIPLDFLSPPTQPDLLGRLGRYEIERVIGAGGMGLVLKGFDGELHRPVAIKVLAPHLAYSAAARKRFAREARATAAVIHPHVIPIHNVETSDKLPYLVMNYINGASLQSYVDAHGPLPVGEALRVALQTVAGMRAAHAQGLIHRDVKPANILLEEGTLRVVLSDFGLARTMDDASLTRTGIVTGTPHYMSPEQAGGDAIDARSDLFSLGCVMYFMLTGRPPFRAATAMGVLNRICTETQRPIREINSSVPVPLAQVIDRLLSKRAEDRYSSAEELEQTLVAVMRAINEGQLRIRHGGSARALAGYLRHTAGKRSVQLVAVALVLVALTPLFFRHRVLRQMWPAANQKNGAAAFTNAFPPSHVVWDKELRMVEWELVNLERDAVMSTSSQWLATIGTQTNFDIMQIESLLTAEESRLGRLELRILQRTGGAVPAEIGGDTQLNRNQTDAR